MVFKPAKADTSKFTLDDISTKPNFNFLCSLLNQENNDNANGLLNFLNVEQALYSSSVLKLFYIPEDSLSVTPSQFAELQEFTWDKAHISLCLTSSACKNFEKRRTHLCLILPGYFPFIVNSMKKTRGGGAFDSLKCNINYHI